MKKLILATTALSLLAAPMMVAPASAAPQRHDRTVVVQKGPNKTVIRHDDNRGPNKTVIRYDDNRRGYQNHRWSRGQRFDRRYATNYRVVDYRGYRSHGVYAPPRGYHWVRSGNDAVLVGITSGLIAAVIAGAIN